jgi:hypothetical protein
MFWGIDKIDFIDGEQIMIGLSVLIIFGGLLVVLFFALASK